MNLTTTVDKLLDATIVLGYGNVGLDLRRRLPGWPEDPPRMDGKVVLVTGSASGIGLAAAKRFAALGASIRAVARDERRAADATAQICEVVGDADVRPLACDLSSLAAIRALAKRCIAEEERLDVVVNNAGVMPDERERSADGHELMFATHVLGPLALTQLLSDLLERSAPARVINVSSGGMYAQGLPADDFESEYTSYGPKKLYARTKREEVVITELLAERMEPRGVFVHAMHPGWVDTKGVRTSMPAFRAVTGPVLRTPEQGADTIVWLGGAPDALERGGLFWHDRRPRPSRYLFGPSSNDPQARAKLWDYCQLALERHANASSAL